MSLTDLTTLEVHCILRTLRSAKQTLEDSWNLLETKRDAVGNGDTDAALLTIENQLYVVNGALRKVWDEYLKLTHGKPAREHDFPIGHEPVVPPGTPYLGPPKKKK